MRVDLNADLGEGWGAYRMGDDPALLSIITSANVACGFHAGDPLVMHDTLVVAKARGVAVGAHPSFLDPWGFGRRRIVGEDPADIAKIIIYQLGAIRQMAAVVGHPVSHVKPHGTLYTEANMNAGLAQAIADAVRAVDPSLILMAMPGLELERAGLAAGLRIAREVFADRAYGDDGNLVPRSKPGAMIHDPQAAAQRVVRMVLDREVETISGRRLPIDPETICVHGDNPVAVETARRIRDALDRAGVAVKPFAAD